MEAILGIVTEVRLTAKEAAVVRWYLESIARLGPNGQKLLRELQQVTLPYPY